MDKGTINKALEGKSREELLDIIYEMSNASEPQKWLLDYCEEKGSSSVASDIAWERIHSLWWEVQDLLDENRYGYNDDVDYCLGEISRICEDSDIPWELRESLVDDILDSIPDNDDYSEVLFGAASSLCREKDELRHFAKRIMDGPFRHNLKSAAASILRSIGDEDLYLAYMEKNLTDFLDFLDLADFYESKVQHDLAMGLAGKALNAAERYQKPAVVKWMFETLSARGDSQALRELWQRCKEEDLIICSSVVELFYHYFKDDYEIRTEALLSMAPIGKDVLAWFRRCREELKEEDFQARLGQLLSTLERCDPPSYMEVLLEMGRFEEALGKLEAKMSSFVSYDPEHAISRKLQPLFTQEIYDLYWMEVCSIVEISNAKEYKRAVSTLRDIKQMVIDYGLDGAWSVDYRYFLEKFRKKRALMALINQDSFL